MKAPKRPSGYIIYRGPSRLDGKPIVVVAITASSNSKTGNMVQTYILVDNGKTPLDNVRSLADASICGDCKHRQGTGGACYVNLGQGPRAVANGVVRGIYPQDLDGARKAAARRMVRLGTYGDPAAVPLAVWTSLLAKAAGNTGYTHAWKRPELADTLELCMASADTPEERQEAKARGYRTFRIRVESQPIAKGEFMCPASAEAGMKRTCDDCGACDGGVGTRKADPVIVVHGSLASRFNAQVAS